MTGDNAGDGADKSELLEVVRPGAVLRGLAGPEPVTIVAVDRLTDDSANVAYRTESGALAERMVFSSHLPGLTSVQAGAAFSSDGDPASFKLAAEARRMRLAHLFDPQAALAHQTSTRSPISCAPSTRRCSPASHCATCSPTTPVLAAIMAGLLVKQLLMRGDAQNVMVVAPGSLVARWADEMRDKFGLDFALLTKDAIEQGGNPFARGGLWLARLDVLARNKEAILEQACEIDWDLVIFDEAHKLSATVFGPR